MPTSLLDLPQEVRLMIYHSLYHNTTIRIYPRTETKNHSRCQTDLAGLQHFLLSCRQIYAEAYPVLCSQADFVYTGHIEVCDVRTICAANTRFYMRRLYSIFGFAGFLFGSSEEMNAWFPNLEVLSVTQMNPEAFLFFESEYDALDYESWIEFLQWCSPFHVRILRLLEGARFKVYVRTEVMVVSFGDNSRNLEHTCTLYVDVQKRQLLRENVTSGDTKRFMLSLFR